MILLKMWYQLSGKEEIYKEEEARENLQTCYNYSKKNYSYFYIHTHIYLFFFIHLPFFFTRYFLFFFSSKLILPFIEWFYCFQCKSSNALLFIPKST